MSHVWSSVFDYRQHTDFNEVLSFHSFGYVLTVTFYLMLMTELHLVIKNYRQRTEFNACGPHLSVLCLCADGHIQQSLTLHLVVSIRHMEISMKLLPEPDPSSHSKFRITIITSTELHAFTTCTAHELASL